MVAISPASRRQREDARLEAILLQELARLTPDMLPGVDGMTVDQMLRDYGRWMQQGAVPGPQRLACQYPELAAQLRTYFAR